MLELLMAGLVSCTGSVSVGLACNGASTQLEGTGSQIRARIYAVTIAIEGGNPRRHGAAHARIERLDSQCNIGPAIPTISIQSGEVKQETSSWNQLRS